ncbi:hypothetical protein FBZ92_10340 [Nitrospirillum viridazoti]|uniref:Uncharacterized protein n=2 Tax=Nitrospirillum TaxID=1543705 RepID=A0A560IZE5_9PROT|nr:hypothetical protein FBZ92_10340 [Nitrospirillum amazonense]
MGGDARNNFEDNLVAWWTAREGVFSGIAALMAYFAATSFIVSVLIGYMQIDIYLKAQKVSHIGDSLFPVLQSVGVSGIFISVIIASIILIPATIGKNFDRFIGVGVNKAKIGIYFTNISVRYMLVFSFYYARSGAFISLFSFFMKKDGYGWLCDEVTGRCVFGGDGYQDWLLAFSTLIYIISFIMNILYENKKAESLLEIIFFNTMMFLFFFFIIEYAINAGLHFVSFTSLSVVVLFIVVSHFIWRHRKPEKGRSSSYVMTILVAPLLLIPPSMVITNLMPQNAASAAVRLLRMGDDLNPIRLQLSGEFGGFAPRGLNDIVDKDNGLITIPVCIVLEIGNKIFVRPAIFDSGSLDYHAVCPNIRNKEGLDKIATPITLRSDQVLAYLPLAR